MKTVLKATIIEELTIFAEDFLLENYQLTLTIPIEINGRLKRRMGRFHFTRDEEPVKIDLSKNLIEYNEFEIVKNVLMHELIHYALFVQNKPYWDGHPVFEKELEQHAASSTGTLKMTQNHHVYHCGCNHIHRLQIKTGTKYLCTMCGERLVYSHEYQPEKYLQIK